MKILFTLLYLPENSIDDERGLYIDLAKECVRQGHEVTLVGSSLIQTRFSKEANMGILRIKAMRIVGESNLIRKGVAMAVLPLSYKRTFYKYCGNFSYDWIVLPTPPQ